MGSKLIKVALLVVLAAALSAPIASAKRYDPPNTFPAAPSNVVAGANAVYTIGCKNGTIPGTTGGDNNNYDYYGNPCNAPVPSSPNLGSTFVPTPTVTGKVCGGNDDYDYYGGACSN